MHIAAVREKLITAACIYFSLRMLTLCRLLKGIKKKEQNCSLPVPLLLSHTISIASPSVVLKVLLVMVFRTKTKENKK